MWSVDTIYRFYIVMKHIYRLHEQFTHTFTFLLWLIFYLHIAKYCKIYLGNPMDCLANTLKYSWLF